MTYAIEIPGALADTVGAITLRALANAMSEASGEIVVLTCKGGDLHDGAAYVSQTRKHKLTKYGACRALQTAFLETKVSP